MIARAEAEAIDEKLADAQVLVEDWRLDLELCDSEHPTRQSPKEQVYERWGDSTFTKRS